MHRDGGYFLKPGEVEVLGISGKARSGKDFLTKAVVVPAGFLPISLADHFKISAAAKGVLSTGEPFDVDVEQLWEKDKDDAHREVLQLEGTERGRDVFGEDIWVKHLELWFYKFKLYGFRRFVVPDIRFVNEVQAIQRLGGKVYRIIKRGGITNGLVGHRSELELDSYEGFDRFIDNSPENLAVFDQLASYLEQDFGLDYRREYRKAG